MKRREELRHDLHTIFQAALQAVDPGEAIRTHVRRAGNQLYVADRIYDLRQYDALSVIGVGKAGAAMAIAVEALLGDRLRGGHVIVKYGHGAPVTHVTVHEAGHPIPDEAGVRATRTLIDFVTGRGPRELLICLLSGGGSALSPAPVEGITLAEKQEVTRLLLACGATIHEINALRKHISRMKGGQLARLASPATLITLVLSDVVGDSLDVIASGPTVPDTSTFADCLEILRKYQLLDQRADDYSSPPRSRRFRCCSGNPQARRCGLCPDPDRDHRTQLAGAGSSEPRGHDLGISAPDPVVCDRRGNA